MLCPKCGSGNTQKSSAAYEQGVRITQGRSTGFFVTSKGTLGVGKSRHQSRSTTLASELNAPPRPLPTRSILVGGVGILLSVAALNSGIGLLGFLVLVVGTFWAAIYFSAPTETESREEEGWQSQWYCKKCGDIFFEGGDAARRSHGGEAFVAPVLRSTKRNPRKLYVDRVLDPVQRAASLTERDSAGLNAIKGYAAADGSFDPVEMGCDLGVVSRLASLGLITYNRASDRFSLTNLESIERPRRGWWQRTFGG